MSIIVPIYNLEKQDKEQRKKLLDEMFVYQDGNNCERVTEWIKSLDK